MRSHRFLLFLALTLALTAATWTGYAAEGPAEEATAAATEPHEWDVDGLELLLPQHETAYEREMWLGREHEMPAPLERDDPPPLAPVRGCAEWEPCTGVMIRYPLGLPYNLLRDFDDDVILHVVVSSGSQASAQSALSNNGVNMDQVQWLIKPNESIWTRDYGPWFVFDGNDELAVLDHTYNRPWRPNDNLTPIYFAEQQGLPVHSHSMYHTGGNYMTDGAHISSSTELVYNEAASYNGMNQAEVDQLMFDYYGVQNYMVLDYIESGGIHHIDTWAKFLDEETVLVKDVWPSHWTYDDLEQRAALLASLPSSTGRNYQVHRVYCYNIGGNSPASYTNSLILNDNIYVPTFGNANYDAAAIETYQEAAPGYTVRGYYYSSFISDDALHCRAKGMMDRHMLRVGHIPVREEREGEVVISAHILAHSGGDISSAQLAYRHDGGDFNVIGMSTANRDSFRATIPAPTDAATCDYYILAGDEAGKTEGMPRVAPAYWYSFAHGPGTVAVTETPAAGTRLHQNHPNPFNPHTTFSFELHHAGRVELVVLDARGRLVVTLVDEVLDGGPHAIFWDGRDGRGRSVASGTYYYRLRAAGMQYSRAATLVK